MVKTVEGESSGVKNLREFQQKSAAIETIFTLAVLYVSVLQIFSLSGVIRYIALIPVLFLLVVALLIGGDNLWEQINQAL